MNTIETSIDIAAPTEAVWDVLTDFGSYGDWNPFVREISGTVAEGERLRVRLDPPDGRTMTFKPRVTAAVPGERLEWLGHLLVPGLFDGRHEFRLERVDDDHTRVHHRESFSGVLVGLFLDAADVTEGFEQMNEALRARIEDGTVATDPEVDPVTA
ncbi:MULTISPECIES: SRPBCC domain-containing protein [Haloarcula]|uniref:SRPBCC domain-containing protein n=1 Tax=Haloarcula TaxID=2237 RepID=UPI0023ED5B7D|nr:SRPBCC domain-containing protein [Halomicroarcula sp. XH51]